MKALCNYKQKIKKYGLKYALTVLVPRKIKYYADPKLMKLSGLIFKHCKLTDTIVLESHNDFDSNGGAFYDYLIKNGYNKKYKIVWLLWNKAPKQLPDNVTCVQINKVSIKRYYYLYTAKYILTCHLIVGSYQRGQISLYMTHGPVGLKAFRGKTFIPSNLTHILMPSEYMQPIMEKQYEMVGSDSKEICLYENHSIQRVILGYPMHDLLYSDASGDLYKLTEAKYLKVILWMPTFRKGKYERNDSTETESLGIPIFDNFQSIEKMNDYLAERDALLIIKIHPMQDLETVKIRDMSNIKVLDGNSVKALGIDNYRLMKDTDALISDYSSVAYDYLHLDRPIGFTMDDANSYKLGFIIEDPKELIGGQIINSGDDFLKFINDVLEGRDLYREKRHEVFDKVFKFHDGNSSKRLIDFLNL